MVKYPGFNKIKTAVFISGTGSNFKSLIKFSFQKKSPITIKYVISNNLKASGLGYANKYRIKKRIYEFKKKTDDENQILKELKKNKVYLICLAGFMKILSKNFIKKFKGQIINIHPSLLPKYKGLNTHEKAIKNKDKFAGCTVHYVTNKLDSGKIIMQKRVKISSRDNLASLAKKVLKQEHKLYPAAVMKIFS